MAGSWQICKHVANNLHSVNYQIAGNWQDRWQMPNNLAQFQLSNGWKWQLLIILHGHILCNDRDNRQYVFYSDILLMSNNRVSKKTINIIVWQYFGFTSWRKLHWNRSWSSSTYGLKCCGINPEFELTTLWWQWDGNSGSWSILSSFSLARFILSLFYTLVNAVHYKVTNSLAATSHWLATNI